MMVPEVALSIVRRYASRLRREPEEVAEDLETFRQLLLKWQSVQNLVSRETLSSFWDRHVADSLQLTERISTDDQHFLDLGSGGGLPAVPLAIALKRSSSNTQFTLVDSNQRKASFLRTVARELALPIRVDARRVEEIDSRETFKPDVITSRALAPLTTLCRLSAPFFGPSTRALFHKGREFVEEVEESRALWHFDMLVVESDTNAGSAILELRNLRSLSDS